MKNITKEMFCKLMESIERENDLTVKLNVVLQGFDRGNQIFSTGLPVEIVLFLANIFDDVDNDWISYWMWELDFGTKYKSGDVVFDGKNVPLATSGDLYDLLMENLKK